MKKLLLFVVALAFAAMHVTAADIDILSAQALAQRFLVDQSSRKNLKATVAPTVKWVHQEMNSSRSGQVAYYVVNTDRGFVIVAGDDRAQTILAYGDGELDMNNLPENMRSWLGYYKRQMELLQSRPGMVVKKPALREAQASVEPLITAKWDQGYPYYSQCPMDGDRRGQTGCATTSLAQVFNKWKYPTQPTPVVPGYTTRTRGFVLPELPSITFDWANILDTYRVGYYNNDNMSAVASLMRYIGQAEEMDYTADGSEAFEDDIIRACHLFGYVDAYVSYKSKVNFYTREDSVIISDDEWKEMLLGELTAGRPVVYCAYSYSNAYDTFYGHAFNVDGYDAATGLFSINWGWSGTGNGYFALNAFANQSYTYNMGQLMVMGIEPPAPIEAYTPEMLPASEDNITLTSFRAEWTDETPAENVASYTLEVNVDDGSEPGVYEMVLSEDFPYATGNSSTTIKNMDGFASNKGWTCSNAYEARGGIRLGGGGSVGTLTTPALDMTQSGGKMTVVVKLRPHKSEDTDVPVSISCGSSVEHLVVTTETTYSIVLKCTADDAQHVTISATDGGNTKRIVVDKVDIYSSTADAASMRFTIPAEQGDSLSRTITGITSKFYTVKDLVAGGTFLYRVKAHYVNGTQSLWSNTQQVTLVEGAHPYDQGDVDHDGEVAIKDVSALIDYLLTGDDSNICTTCADVNGKDGVDIGDVSALIDILLNAN